ncbi:MAG TPA: ROK family protein [Aigarchaeota archaeon]|nr:ROK family protein [Aigarchaeota archaeon]
MNTVGAVDLGATWTRIAIADGDGRIIARRRFKTPRVEKALRRSLAEAFRGLMEEAGVGRLDSVGVASIGPLSMKEGVILGAPNLGMERIDVAGAIREFHSGPLVMLNDCNAAVLGERLYGAGQGVDNLAYLTISTGIGCGAIVNGKLLFGKDGNAAEAGHVVVDYKLRVRCGCGGYGHWEALCSGKGLLNLAKLVTGRRRWRTAQQLFEAAEKHRDRQARLVLREAARINAAGMAAIINNFDPELLTIGGGVALNHRELVIEWALRSLSRYVLNRMPRITPTPLGEEAPLLGAVAAAVNPPEEAVVLR